MLLYTGWIPPPDAECGSQPLAVDRSHSIANNCRPIAIRQQSYASITAGTH